MLERALIGAPRGIEGAGGALHGSEASGALEVGEDGVETSRHGDGDVRFGGDSSGRRKSRTKADF